MSSAAIAAASEEGFASSLTVSEPPKCCDDTIKLHSPHPQTSALATSPATTITISSDESSSDDDEDVAANDGQDCYYTLRAQRENERLNLNLGLPVDLTVFTRPANTIAAANNGIAQKVLRPPIQSLLRFLDRLLSFLESPLFNFWANRVPLRLRQKMTFLAWGIYLPIHKALIGRRTGLHKNVSLEYHALTSVMWWGRLFPITIKRMRFSISQMHVLHPPDEYPQWNIMKNPSSCNTHNTLNKPSNGARYGIRGHLNEVYHQMKQKRTPTGIINSITEASTAEMTVTGQFIQHDSAPSQKVIFWIYGGAFLAGDSKGNLGIAEKMGMMCAAGEEGGDMRDVFIPDYRLVPEYHLDDAIHDITLAFEYLIYERGIKPENITLFGVSSGGGLVVILLQALAKAQREFDERTKVGGGGGDDDSSVCVPMPAGGVLMGPFVDYTEPKGSMKEYIKHDLVVNQSVFDGNIKLLEEVLGSHENRVNASPVYGNFEGVPPLCICVSEHEVVYDQAMMLAKRAKEHGVDVTVGVWKYMCHIFPLLCPFVPEGRESFNFMCEWIKKR